MRKAVEAVDHLLVAEGEVEIERLAEHGVERNGARLIVAIFRMLERHIEEHALIAGELLIETLGDRPFGKGECLLVGGECTRIVARRPFGLSMRASNQAPRGLDSSSKYARGSGPGARNASTTSSS